MEVFLATGARAIHGQGCWNHAKECKFQKKTYSSSKFTGPGKTGFKVQLLVLSCKCKNRNNNGPPKISMS